MNDWERQHRQAQRYKEAYPPGTRLMLLSMNDPHHPVESGTRGTVDHVDDMGTIHMKKFIQTETKMLMEDIILMHTLISKIFFKIELLKVIQLEQMMPLKLNVKF